LLKKLHREIAEACNQIAGLMLAQDTACPWGGAFRTEYFRDRTPFLLEQMPEKTAAGTGIIFVLGHAWPSRLCNAPATRTTAAHLTLRMAE
jgi:hypothetical protein